MQVLELNVFWFQSSFICNNKKSMQFCKRMHCFFGSICHTFGESGFGSNPNPLSTWWQLIHTEGIFHGEDSQVHAYQSWYKGLHMPAIT